MTVKGLIIMMWRNRVRITYLGLDTCKWTHAFVHCGCYSWLFKTSNFIVHIRQTFQNGEYSRMKMARVCLSKSLIWENYVLYKYVCSIFAKLYDHGLLLMIFFNNNLIDLHFDWCMVHKMTLNSAWTVGVSKV